MHLSTLAKKGLKKIFSIPSLTASKFIEMPSISAKLDDAYWAARRKHHSQLPILSAADAAIVAGLEQTGLFITDLDSLGLPGTAEMLAAGQGLADNYAERDRRGQLRYWDAFQATAKEILSHKEIFYWGLNRRLLEIVEVYLGLPVAFDCLNIFFTKADGRQVAARKWHLDVEDRRMVKIAVYLNDVDADGGPFQILLRDLPGSETIGRPARMIFTQEKLERTFGRPLGDNDIVTCTGKAGTVIFSDTASRYHRGKPAASRDRCAMFYSYMSRPPLRPFFCERGTLSRSQIDGLATGLEASQRECLLWRKKLPLLTRMIPPAPIG